MSSGCKLRRRRPWFDSARSCPSPPKQLVAAARASEVSRGDQFQRVDLKRRVGQQPLEPAIFVFEAAHLGDIADLEAAELRLPLVERHRANAVLAAELRRLGAGLGLFEHADDLLFGEPGFLHEGDSCRAVWPGILYS